MLCCVAEIAMLVFGIIALVRGKFALTRSRIVQKVPARIIGVILLLPFVVFMASIFVLVVVVAKESAAQGKESSILENMGIQATFGLVNGGVTLLSLLTGLIVAIATAKPPRSKRRRLREEEEEDDYDDRPRRRRRDDDEDDDRPRRRSRDDDDDDDRPRGRPPDDRIRER